MHILVRLALALDKTRKGILTFIQINRIKFRFNIRTMISLQPLFQDITYQNDYGIFKKRIQW